MSFSEIEKKIKEKEGINFHKVRIRLKYKEKFFAFLFYFLLFLLILSFFYHFLIKKEKGIVYKGKFSTYFKKYENGEERWFYSVLFNGKRYDIPLSSSPYYFENLSLVVKRPAVLHRNVVIVFSKKDNLSVITTATFNLARILILLGYKNKRNLFTAFLENNTVNVVDSSLRVIARGPIECNSNITSFILLNASSTEDRLIYNGSCILIKSCCKKFLSYIDLLSVLLTYKYNIR